ncbi:hypothetical protein R3W88_004787 [Solanum pinnatisectum]|uniref:Endonuclease/exonuclease/phosphatase domain-containing protein n=1 Tax=Solanum pinnatisectum TaxID=50273 RepID=A0AAV9KAE6_9SOLN|nr:hypothetical protein R3W88_004787 [Solanum pinnatisectum]
MIGKIIFWNIRSVNTQKAFERLIDLNRRHQYSFIALMEPFQGPQELEQYKIKLGFNHSFCNCSAKIWIFWEEGWNVQIIKDSGQQVTMSVICNNVEFLLTVVYARCSSMERLELWDEMEDIAQQHQKPWMIGGDFNVILNEEEKQGGLPFMQREAMEFAQCINNCGLIELKYSGSNFTWWNGRIEEHCIFKRLDRVMGNQEFMDLLPSSEVQHLIRRGSNHVPLHVTCNTEEEPMVRPFKFLNFWTKHPQFKKLIEDNWKVDFAGSPFLVFQAKIKQCKGALSKWSKEVFGDIFRKIATLEDVIKAMEAQFEVQPSKENRASLKKAKADLKKYWYIEEEYWK